MNLYKNITNITAGGLLALTLLSGAILSSPLALADNSATNDITINVPISCNLSSSTTTNHTATVDAGTYRSEIGESTITATCNDSDGFAIYAIGYTGEDYGNNTLKHTTDNTLSIASGTATSGATSNWAMKLTAVSGTYTPTIETTYSSYATVPTTYTKVASKDSSTDTVTGASFKSTYAAYISSTQHTGTYEGKVKYTLVNPSDAATPIVPVTIATAEYLQEVNSCPADLPEEQVYTLKDSRDEQEYKVAKLKDGKCWMVENLNIAGGTALSSDDTDFDANYILPTTNGWTVSNNKLVLPASSTSGFEVQNDYANVYNSGNKENCGASGQDIPCYSYYTWDAATLGSSRTISMNNDDAPYSICPKGWKLPTSGSYDNEGWKRGDFYVLTTAYGANTEDNPEDTSLETGGRFYFNAGPGTIPNFQLGGYYLMSSFYDGGSRGYYYASTGEGGSFPTELIFDSAITSPTQTWPAGFGFSVRCLVD